VVRTRVGYAGGTKKNPTYRSLGDHSETIQIDYDPSKISYRNLLRAFWTGHDPTYQSWSRQYASIIFVHDEEQRREAKETRAEVERERGVKVYTEIIAYSGFTLAEDYHQKHSLRQFPAFQKELNRIYPSFDDFMNSTAVARVNGYLGNEGTYDELLKEADSLGLSSARKEELLRLVERQRGRQACPIPEQGIAAGAH
jgi:peptide-methionine (S)-S-oxide reductase